MCVAVTIEREAPSLAQLERMYTFNQDGAGVAWLAKGKVHWRKGLTSALEVHKILARVPRPALAHFRLASVGGKALALTHPFPLDLRDTIQLEGQANSVLIHNGHWGSYELVTKVVGRKAWKGPLSDTRVLAYLAALRGVSFLKWVEGQRMATLDSKGTITRYGLWNKMDGFHCSNRYWEFEPRVATLPALEVPKYLTPQHTGIYASYEEWQDAYVPRRLSRLTDSELARAMAEYDEESQA